MSTEPAGCVYGFRLQTETAQAYLNEDDPSLPSLNVHFAAGPAPQAPAGWSSISLSSSWTAHVSPAADALRCYSDPPYVDDAVIHPGVSTAAVIATLHLRGEALHAGAVLTPAGAVALLAGREGGKTTTLGYLASRLDLPVLTDDQLLMRANDVGYAGPRCLDLRPDALRALELDQQAIQVRNGSRHRYRLADVPLSAPVVETVLLEWGDQLTVETVPPTERLARLVRQRTLPNQPGGRFALLGLASLPMRRLTRPRGASHLPAVARALLGG